MGMVQLRKQYKVYARSSAQKMKFHANDFFRKFDQIHRKLRPLLHLLKKSSMENFTFCKIKSLLKE